MMDMGFMFGEIKEIDDLGWQEPYPLWRWTKMSRKAEAALSHRRGATSQLLSKPILDNEELTLGKLNLLLC